MTKKRMEKIRKMDDEELHRRVNEIDNEVAKFRACASTGESLIRLPTGDMGGIKWGTYQELKREKSRILSVLNERFNRRAAIRKPRRA